MRTIVSVIGKVPCWTFKYLVDITQPPLNKDKAKTWQTDQAGIQVSPDLVNSLLSVPSNNIPKR